MLHENERKEISLSPRHAFPRQEKTTEFISIRIAMQKPVEKFISVFHFCMTILKQFKVKHPVEVRV